MFVVLESLGVIQDNTYFKDKELSKGSETERSASQFLELSSNPKGNSAYKTISTMLEENTFVTTDAQCINVTSIQTLQSLALQLGIKDSKFIKIYLKDDRVTASCRLRGRNFGARGNNLNEAFDLLLESIVEFQT